MIDQKQRPSASDAPENRAAGAGAQAEPGRIHGEARSQVDQIDDTPVVETPVEVRQGFLGRPVLIVLGVSLCLAVLAGVAVGFIPV